MGVPGLGFVALLTGLLGSGWPGTSVMPLLSVEQGPRLAAMGGAGISLVDDASAIYWNPAGLGRIGDNRYAFSHHQCFAGIKDELLHAALPARYGTFGLGLVYSGESGIEKWTGANLPHDTFQASNLVGSVGYGLGLGGNCHLGAVLEGLMQDLGNQRGYGAAAKIGFTYRPSSSFGIGVVGRNLGLALYGGELYETPAEAGLGGSFSAGPVSAALDAVADLEGWRSLNGMSELANVPLHLHAGAEYQPAPELAVRLGYRTGPQDWRTLGLSSGLTAGLGLRYGALRVDYAVISYGSLGLTHRIGLEAVIPREGRGRVWVKVVDSVSTAPLVASVTTTGAAKRKGETGFAGGLEIAKLPAGELVIRTERAGYLSRTDTMLILGDREQTAIIALKSLSNGDVTGVVYDADAQKPIGGSVVYRGPSAGWQVVEPKLGAYALKDLPAGEYTLTAQGPSDEYVAQTCTTRVVTGRTVRRDFYLARQRRAAALPSVSFASGRAEITPDMEAVLSGAGAILAANPALAVELAGHTDATEGPSQEFPSNWELSQARAEAVRRYLVAKSGIAPERLSAHGYADTQPIAGSDTEEGRARNRRTELRITSGQ